MSIVDNSFLCSAGVVWGDLKPENVLISQLGHVKLADFGSSRIISVQVTSGEPEPDMTSIDRDADVMPNDELRLEGTAEYIAPELLAGEPSSAASDAWALGIVLFQMIAGHTPVLTTAVDDPTLDAVAAQRATLQAVKCFAGISIRAGESFFPAGFDTTAQDLVTQLLSLQPAARFGLQMLDRGQSGDLGQWTAVQRHPFFRKDTGTLDDWSKIFERSPPMLGEGLVSATTAMAQRWNRRKQSMLMAPMPEDYDNIEGGMCKFILLPYRSFLFFR